MNCYAFLRKTEVVSCCLLDGLEFRILILVDWLSHKSRESNLPCVFSKPGIWTVCRFQYPLHYLYIIILHYIFYKFSIICKNTQTDTCHYWKKYTEINSLKNDTSTSLSMWASAYQHSYFHLLQNFPLHFSSATLIKNVLPHYILVRYCMVHSLRKWSPPPHHNLVIP